MKLKKKLLSTLIGCLVISSSLSTMAATSFGTDGKVMSDNGELSYTITTPYGSYTDTVRVDKIDKELPSVSVTTNGNVVSYSVSDSLSGISTISFTDGKEIDMNGNHSANGSHIVNADGTFDIIVEDVAGNITTETFTVAYDPTTPTDGSLDEDPDNGTSSNPDPGTGGSPGSSGGGTGGSPGGSGGSGGSPGGSGSGGSSGSSGGSSGSGGGGGSSSSKTSENLNDSLAQIKENLPFTLPTGEVNLAKYQSGTLDDVIIEVTKGINNIKLDVKGITFESILEGIATEGNDKVFKDVPATHWAHEAIESANHRGFLLGVNEDSYCPKAGLNYADTFTGLNRVLMLNHILEMQNTRSTVESVIKDYDTSHWAYYSYASILSKLAKEDMVTIGSKGEANYTVNITRAELAKVLCEVTDGIGLKETKQVVQYNDMETVSDYIKAVTVRGLMHGDDKGNFNPYQTLTRAELASVLIRLDDCIASLDADTIS